MTLIHMSHSLMLPCHNNIRPTCRLSVKRLFVEESINDSISVDLGICNTGGIGNNELVVAVQR